MGSKYILVEIKFLVSECLSYSQSLPIIGFYLDLCLVMKFVYTR